MGKYNIKEIKPKMALYRTKVRPDVMDELKDKVLEKILIEKKYKEKSYSAQMLARDLETNARYISAVMNVKFHMNYTSFVNKFRVDEAMTILADRRYSHLSIEEVSDIVGFSNRQSLYASFYRLQGMTPRDYRLMHTVKGEKKEEAEHGNRAGKRAREKGQRQ